MTDAITLDERSRLYKLEETIEHGLNTFVDVGNALLEIRDSKLYRQDFTTFEDYCKERWGIERRRAYQLMDAAKAVENVYLSTQTVPVNELQARPLTALDPQEQIEAWKRVIENTPEGKITAAVVLKAAKEIQQEKRDERRAERVEKIVGITSNNKPLDSIGKFPVIYADPPWRYDFSSTVNREIENQYPTMDIEEICGLNINMIANDDCVLFIWATNPKLIEALKVIEAWGFEYKTNFVWVKDKIGMGYYARQQHELLLIATKGNLPTPDPSVRPSSVIYSDREQHSQKPLIVYDLIETMYPDFRKVELFARIEKKGWNAWGNQI
jgi:N6-adenosine-specific RNA methylase IME4